VTVFSSLAKIASHLNLKLISLLKVDMKMNEWRHATLCACRCSQHFTQLDIKQAVGNSAFLHLQNALVGLFCCEFGAAWNKICPQCSTQDFAATLVPSTELEYLGLREGTPVFLE
jgi:hypothetical protein